MMRRKSVMVLVSASGAAISVSPDAHMLYAMQKHEPGSRVRLYANWLRDRQKVQSAK